MEYNINETTIRNNLKKYCKEVNKYFKAGNIESSYNKPVIDLIQSFERTDFKLLCFSQLHIHPSLPHGDSNT